MRAPGDWTGRCAPAVARDSGEPRVGVSATVKHQAIWPGAMQHGSEDARCRTGTPPDCCCIAAYGCVQRHLDIQLATRMTGMMIGQHH